MKIKEWHKPDDQMSRIGRHHWSVPRLFELTRHLPVMDVCIDHMTIDYSYTSLTLREMVMHMRAVVAADLDCPIILDEDGSIMDGRHRLMKALLHDHKTIKAVRFEENPPPDKVDEA